MGVAGREQPSRPTCAANPSKRKGIWVGGPVPLGYQCIDKKLVVVPEEAGTVGNIFARYLELGSMGVLMDLELGSMGVLMEDLDRHGIRTKAVDRRQDSGRDFWHP